MNKKQKQKIRSSIAEFMIVGLGKNGNPFHHFVEEDSKVITLHPEPTNKYDKHAISVHVDDHHVGYVSSQHNIQIGQFIKRKNHKFQFYLIDKYSASARWLIIDLTLCLKRKNTNKLK